MLLQKVIKALILTTTQARIAAGLGAHNTKNLLPLARDILDKKDKNYNNEPCLYAAKKRTE